MQPAARRCGPRTTCKVDVCARWSRECPRGLTQRAALFVRKALTRRFLFAHTLVGCVVFASAHFHAISILSQQWPPHERETRAPCAHTQEAKEQRGAPLPAAGSANCRPRPRRTQHSAQCACAATSARPTGSWLPDRTKALRAVCTRSLYDSCTNERTTSATPNSMAHPSSYSLESGGQRGSTASQAVNARAPLASERCVCFRGASTRAPSAR